MKYYILECRKRIQTDRVMPNKVEQVIGIFTSIKNAESWISTEGMGFYPKHYKRFKYNFWALVEITKLNETSGSLVHFYKLS